MREGREGGGEGGWVGMNENREGLRMPGRWWRRRSTLVGEGGEGGREGGKRVMLVKMTSEQH